LLWIIGFENNIYFIYYNNYYYYYLFIYLSFIYFWKQIGIRVQILQDPSVETFSKQLLDIGDGKVALHENTGCIKLPNDCCTIINSQNDFIVQIFPDIHTQYLNHEWMVERAILAAKKCGCRRFEFQDTTVDTRRLGVIQIYRYSLRYQWNCKLSSRVFELIGFSRHATTPFTTEGRISYYNFVIWTHKGCAKAHD